MDILRNQNILRGSRSLQAQKNEHSNGCVTALKLKISVAGWWTRAVDTVTDIRASPEFCRAALPGASVLGANVGRNEIAGRLLSRNKSMQVHLHF
jgi:hypothetical protein